MRGHCKCRNIELVWHCVDFSIVPRKCQCSFCSDKDMAYVFKAGTRIDMQVHKNSSYQTRTQGSGTARFHQCSGCGEVVAVTAEIEDQTFAALNARCMQNKFGFAAPREPEFHEQTVEEKLRSWRQNWCCPVRITVEHRAVSAHSGS